MTTRPGVTLDGLGRRQLLAGGVASLMLAVTGCGYILYPERRGRISGRIDLPVLIIDLLWLLPGLLPGVVCLVVDFTSGCIYEGGGRAAAPSPAPEEDPGHAVHIELDGAVVATGQLQPDGKTHLTWTQTFDEATVRAKARVVVRTRDGAVAQAAVRDLV